MSRRARRIAWKASIGLAVTCLAGCTTSDAFRARWYVQHPRGDTGAPADLYVLLENVGTRPAVVEGVYLNSGEGRRLQVDWEGVPFEPGDIRLALVNRATKVDGEYRLPCAVPVRLLLVLPGKQAFGTVRWAKVPVDGALPSSLPDEWLHCRAATDSAASE